MKRLYLVATMLLTGLYASAQTITVTDINTMAPLSRVKVSTASATVGETDARGQLDISSAKGADSLTFVLSGFQTERHSLKDLEAQNFNIFLFQNSYSLDDVIVSANKFEEKRK